MQSFNFLENTYLKIHKKYFNYRKKKQKYFQNKYIISIGNLSVGGTGKTPTSKYILSHLLKKNKQSLIVLRGYKGKLSSKSALVFDGKNYFHTVKEVGDEAFLFTDIPNTKVVIGKNRIQAIKHYGTDISIILLDDAFQNPSIYHNHAIVLIDATLSLEKMKLFPCGKLREPLCALKRADTVLLTRYDQANKKNRDSITSEILKHVKEDALFFAQHKITGIRSIFDTHSKQKNTILQLPHTKKPLGAFCGIANPASFFNKLGDLGYNLAQTKIFMDHHFFSKRDLINLSKSDLQNWITTEKDIIRLERQNIQMVNDFKKIINEKELNIFVLLMQIEILFGKQNVFLNRVLSF